jgi:hypothetical protein
MVYELSSLCKMKDQDSQERASISELVANLLRAKLASKLPESELTTLISETKEVVEKKEQIPKKEATNETVGLSESQIDSHVNKLKSSIDYIEYKCREIERSLRTSDRHVRQGRVFRDRSPLGMFFAEDFSIHGDLHPMRRSVTRSPTAPSRCSHNSWFDSYFS